MSFSYDETLITPKDRIRFTLGDITAPGLVADETIDALLLTQSETLATATLAEGLASKFAQMPSSVSIPGGPGLTWGERVKQWQAVAERFRAEATAASSTAAMGRLASFSLVRAGRDDEVSEYRARWPIYFPGEPFG